MKYAFIQEHVEQFRITTMSRVLGVSRSGYYRWTTGVSQTVKRDKRAQLDRQVAEIFAQCKGRYGAPRVTEELAARGVVLNRKTVAMSLKRQGLRAKAAKRFKVTTDSAHSLPVAPNVLAGDFQATGMDQKWAGDITYLATDEGWLYLAVVIDLYSRRVVGWAMSERMPAKLVCDALTMALWRRHHPTGVIVHSDRGSQYCSHQYRNLLRRYGLVSSMSGTGNCYDNACVESFFHTLKVELVHGESFATREHLRQVVFEYIETDYNRTRRHSTLGYLSPEAFEAANAA